MSSELTRRELLGRGAAGGAALSTGALLANPLVAKALADPPHCGRLTDIEHVVILMQENRSFDHYFGTYRGVRGFGDSSVPASVFQQSGYPVDGFGGKLYPFHLDSFNNGECTNDINHSWGPQHVSWNGGAMDRFVASHVQTNGEVNGALTMGYYERGDLPFYYGLADAFTICDRYHCSVIGPTDPNRLYTMSATLDPAGTGGGPILSTSGTRVERYGKLTWTTMPEQLSARGIDWKVYGSPDGNFGDNVLPYFQKIVQTPKLLARAMGPTFPGTFELDVATGCLPAVSWITAPLVNSEHPPGPVEWGQWTTAHVLSTLASNPKVWAKTALFVTYDENGGFFDHVAPPVADRGTAGEYLTVSTLPPEASGVDGPIGLGFRVPMLVVSPFSRGGFVCSDVFDHTSILRFIETRFGAEVPNLSAWRRSVTGDLTSAFNFVKPDASVPSLPAPSLTDSRVVSPTSTCITSAPLGLAGDQLNPIQSVVEPLVKTYPVPANSMPTQESGSADAPSGIVPCAPAPPPQTGLVRNLLHALGIG